MTKERVTVVKIKSNGDIEYKVLNSVDADMGWLKWSIIFLFVALLCPVFLKSLGVVVVEIVAGVLAAIGIGIFACLVVQSHFLGNAEAKLVENAIKDIVARDAEGLKLKVVKVKFCSDSLDSYGTIDEEYVFGRVRRDISNGYTALSISKTKNILLYFIEKSHGVFITKMNKLLFYTDFLSYRTTGKGMTGLRYKAIQHGPVPVRWDRIYSFYDEINQEIVQLSNDREGTMLVSNLSPVMADFSEEELEILGAVYERFKNETPTQISETSHEEEAWKKYYNTDMTISFDMAFTLKAI